MNDNYYERSIYMVAEKDYNSDNKKIEITKSFRSHLSCTIYLEDKIDKILKKFNGVDISPIIQSYRYPVPNFRGRIFYYAIRRNEKYYIMKCERLYGFFVNSYEITKRLKVCLLTYRQCKKLRLRESLMCDEYKIKFDDVMKELKSVAVPIPPLE